MKYLNNTKNIFKIQKKISLILIIVGCLTLVMNITIGILRDMTIINMLKSLSIYPILVFVIIISITFNLNHISVRILHIVSLLSYSTVCILDTYYSFYGAGLYLLSVAFMYKYRLLEKYIIVKSIFILLYVLICIESSVLLSDEYQQGHFFEVILFLIFFIILLSTIYKDELSSILFKEKSLNNTISSLNFEHKISLEKIENLKNNLILLEEKIAAVSGNPVNLSDFGITRKEEKVIELLCKTNGTNKEIAKEMKISSGTVKQHLNNIFIKLDIRKRMQIVELCRNNYAQETG